MFYVLFAVFILSNVLTYVLRRYALAHNIIDCPNHRSSHVIPTPRGGGVAFVVSFLITIPVFEYLGLVTLIESMAFIVLGLGVASLGFLDDHYSISASWRFLGHVFFCVIAVWWLGGMSSLCFLGFCVSNHLLLASFLVIYLVWLLNLYNFMDGIDGLAGFEAISVCLSVACLYGFSGRAYLVFLPLLLAISVAGFLVWNFPFARIFMGDAGSGFLGFILGVLSIQGASIQPVYFWSWIILLGVFIVDASYTLISRALAGYRIYEAHRSHAYQRASRRLNGHIKVTFAVVILNTLWLFPLAMSVGFHYIDGFIGFMIAYIPLIFLCIYFKAGQSD